MGRHSSITHNWTKIFLILKLVVFRFASRTYADKINRIVRCQAIRIDDQSFFRCTRYSISQSITFKI